MEWKCAALLSVHVKVAELLADFGELYIVSDLDDGSVERFVDITADLGLAFNVVSSFLFNNFGE